MKRSSLLLPLAAVAGAAASSTCGGGNDVFFPKLSCGLKYTTESECTAAGCCFDDSQDGNGNNEPSCFTPDVPGYRFDQLNEESEHALSVTLALVDNSGLFPDHNTDEKNLLFDAVQETSERTHIRITSGDAEKDFWEVPESLLPRPGGRLADDLQAQTVMTTGASGAGEFQFSVSRTDGTSDPIFSLGDNLVFQEQYLQFVVPVSGRVAASFGLGESTRAKQAIGANETRTLWNTDVAAATFDVDLYGAHPFVLQLTSDGLASGYFLLSSNALEASLRDGGSGSGAVMGLQVAGGIIDLYVFSGPTPADVIRQYQEVVGFPALVPYWSLGFHNCEWGYPNLDYVKEVVSNYSAAEIPLETQWLDIDYMDNYLDFTTSPDNFPQQEVAAFIDSLHENNQRFVPIIDPGIYVMDEEYEAYTAGVEQNVFIKDLYGEKDFIGVVWPGNTVFPDWFATNSTSYWTDQLKHFHDIVPYDGVWIDMNEVSNFCNDGNIQTCEVDMSMCDTGCCVSCTTPDPNNRYDFSAWVPHVYHGALGGKTVPVSALHESGVLEYNAHNMYGFMESIATQAALTAITGDRPFLLSRSSFSGSGKHTAHWTGDNAATWEDLAASIVTMSSLSMLGIPMTGADICGFISDTTEELCNRWIQVGAFSPFSRNHNTVGAAPQELYRWESVTEASQNALHMRYKLLPFLYTLLYRAHADGLTVHNALWTHFPEDETTISCDSQYMWSDALLFTPVLEEGGTSVTGYFPKGIWYQLPVGSVSMDNAVIDASGGGMSVTLDTPLDATNIHVRGGSIVSMQGSAMTTTAARETPFELLIALDAKEEAIGTLFVDDGVQQSLDRYSLLKYSFKNGSFISKAVESNFYPADSAKLMHVTIKGLKNDFTLCKSAFATVTGIEERPELDVEVLSAHDVRLKFAVGLSLVQNFELNVHCW